MVIGGRFPKFVHDQAVPLLCIPRWQCFLLIFSPLAAYVHLDASQKLDSHDGLLHVSLNFSQCL